MTKPSFNSIYKDDLQAYLDIRINSMAWNTYRLDFYRLSSFDRYLCSISHDSDIVPQEIINEWLSCNSVPDASLEGYIKAVRGFMQYRVSLGKAAYIPPYRKRTDLYIPYIFDRDELSGIISYVDDNAFVNKHSSVPYVKIEMAMLIRLLYCCGLRLGEALTLQVKHINFTDGIINITHAKSDKQRLVPVHESLNELLNRYCSALGLLGDPEAFIFPGRNTGTGLSQSTAERHFKSILQHQGIIDADRDIHKRGPCLHCLRHCFMLSAFRQLEASGHTVDLAAPYLSTYCGHESLIESEKYLKFSSEMFVEEMAAFSMFSARLFPEVDL